VARTTAMLRVIEIPFVVGSPVEPSALQPGDRRGITRRLDE
jgi:hypothetical protein